MAYAGTLGISNNISQLLEFADFCFIIDQILLFFLGAAQI